MDRGLSVSVYVYLYIMDTESVIHTGTVTAVDSRRREVTVRLSSEEGCDACPAARLCGASGSEGREVRVEVHDVASWPIGSAVRVAGTEAMHRRAIMLATVIPCIALIAVMTAVYLLTGSQSAAGLSGLGAMLVFFILLYLARNRIEHEFRFHILPEGNDSKENLTR